MIGGLLLSPLSFLKFLISPFEAVIPAGHFAGRRRWLFSVGFVDPIPLPFFKIIVYSFDALGPRGGPYFSAPAEK